MITKINKGRLIGLSFIICHLSFSMMFTSCTDMLETDSSRQTFDPELDQKTDSVFYAFGILQGLQQLADQYVFQGEMRGDLVATTTFTDNNLRQLANFSATTANRYDSAYVYYRVINNCNYYVAHRDTTLLTGATNVVMNEYASVKAVRAWAWLQLVRTYGKVPFFTEPLTQISQIDDNQYPELDLSGIVSRLAPDLEQYTGYAPSAFGNINFSVGNDGSGSKVVSGSKLFMPVDVVLGDLYLENGDYANAVRHYIVYLTQVAIQTHTAYTTSFSAGRGSGNMFFELPSNWASNEVNGAENPWNSIFSHNATTDIITYIPMAVNSLRGTTTNIPIAFGYNYYATSSEARASGRRLDEIQIMPSQGFLTLSDSTDYYYYDNLGSVGNPHVSLAKLGDQRANSYMEQGEGEDSTKIWVTKYNNGNILLYRTTTVLMHMAEAFNRLGYPDIAFAILKDGICPELLTYAAYISESSRQALQTTYPLLSDANIAKFSEVNAHFGVHTHGTGMTRDYDAGYKFNNVDYPGGGYRPGLSPYQPDTIIGLKLKEIAQTFGVSVGTTKQDSINAMEDILCDEYALEFAFEGTRWFDLMRMARHKNEAALYDANFGSRWLARKLAYKHPVVNLEDKSNWYLPFR